MSNIENATDTIHRDQLLVDGLRNHISDLYAQINYGLSASGGVITKDIDNLYKEIDSTFGKKSKLEQKINTAKRQIFTELGIN